MTLETILLIILTVAVVIFMFPLIKLLLFVYAIYFAYRMFQYYRLKKTMDQATQIYEKTQSEGVIDADYIVTEEEKEEVYIEN